MSVALKLRFGDWKRRLDRPWLRRTLGVLGGLALCGFVFLVAFYWSWQSSRRADEVRVPEVAGLTAEDAGARLEEAGLVWEILDERSHPEIPSGHVLEQRPSPGLSVRPGRKVRLVVSLGSVVLTVPDIRGKADRAIQIELQREGFRLGDHAAVHDARLSEGRVLAQWPPNNRPAVPNERLHRLVSLGPRVRTYVMPDLRRRPESVVKSWIRSSGLRVGAVRLRSGTGEPRGTVIGQSPLPGHPVRDRDAVQLTVAR